MSVNPFYFVDHNLPTATAEKLILELSEKTNGNFEVVLSKNTLQIISLSQSWDKEFDCYSWDGLNEMFINQVDFANQLKKKLVSQINEILTPVFNCTKFMIVKDTFSSVHQTLHELYLSDEGMTIDEALKRTEEYAEKNGTPFEVLRNEEVFGHSRELEEPIFLFDL